VGGHLLPRLERRTRAAELLARFHDLGRRQATPAGQLSGGERQQLAIARALMIQPKVILLDEPSRGLSPASLTGLLDILQEEAKRGTIALVVDQALDWLEGRVDRLVVMADGRIGADMLPSDAAAGKAAAAYFDLGNNKVEAKS
jgi:branched-chain amino acid transport system ATP-binding protein